MDTYAQAGATRSCRTAGGAGAVAITAIWAGGLVTPALLAVIVAAPGDTPVTAPLAATTATPGALLVQSTPDLIMLPRASRAITRNDAVPRTAGCSLAGITSSETTRAGAGDPTTTVMMALRPSLAAVTSAVPARPPVRTPVDETATTAGSLLDHSMRRPLAALPRPSIATAVTCVDAPGASRTACGVTSTVATVAGGAATVTLTLALLPPLEAVRVAIPAVTA